MQSDHLHNLTAHTANHLAANLGPTSPTAEDALAQVAVLRGALAGLGRLLVSKNLVTQRDLDSALLWGAVEESKKITEHPAPPPAR